MSDSFATKEEHEDEQKTLQTELEVDHTSWTK
jgi:hypothetical protein